MEDRRSTTTTPATVKPWFSATSTEVHELRTSRGRPVWLEGIQLGIVHGETGEQLRVLRSCRGSIVIDRDLNTGWMRDRDIIILDPLEDEERLFEILGFSPEALDIYDRLGIDPVLVVD